MKSLAISWAAVRLALGQIESGNNDHAVGRCGEVSRYQITRDNWRLSHGCDPTSETEAWRVAKGILLIRLSTQSSQNILPRHIYALWHRPGVYYRTGCRFDFLPKRIRERCIRFENLCMEIQSAQQRKVK